MQLQQFHREHFPHQPIPDIQPTTQPAAEVAEVESPIDLGYYEDGVRRTLTDEQIAMFRHSEIQRLLAERRRKKEAEEEQQKRQTRKRKADHGHELAGKPTVFDNDSVVHARPEVEQLSYDENSSHIKEEQVKTFQWPVLGS